MNANDYQQQALTTVTFDPDVAMPYLVSGLAAEAGEVAGKYAKYLRGDMDNVAHALWRMRMAEELGDVLWMAAVLAEELGYPLAEVMQMNLRKLASRQQRGVLQGNGDNR